jgi:peroxiredoxin
MKRLCVGQWCSAPRRVWHGFLAVVLMVTAVGVSVLSLSGQGPLPGVMKAEAAPKIPAKDFQLKDLNGSLVRLSDYRGKQAVLLYFWASWCPSCMEMKPQVAKLRSDVSRDKMEILGVNVGSRDTLERLLQIEKGHPTPYPVLYDDDSKVSRAYQIQGIPVFILIDKEGSVVYRNYQLPKDIQKYLADQ